MYMTFRIAGLIQDTYTALKHRVFCHTLMAFCASEQTQDKISMGFKPKPK